MDQSNVATVIHGPIGITYHPNENAKVTADCLETSLHLVTCVTETMRDGYRLESKFCSQV
jgi:hypothetical protein